MNTACPSSVITLTWESPHAGIASDSNPWLRTDATAARSDEKLKASLERDGLAAAASTSSYTCFRDVSTSAIIRGRRMRQCDAAENMRSSSKSKQNVDAYGRRPSRCLERSFSAAQSGAYTASNPTELVGASAFSRLTGVLHP